MIKKIQTNKKMITEFLDKKPMLRDSDTKLIKAVWTKQVKNMNTLSASQLLDKLCKGEILNPETIRRCRQKVQEENKSLRGKNYQIRHKMASKTRKAISK